MESRERCEHCGDNNYCCRVIMTHSGPIIYFRDEENHVTTYKAHNGRSFDPA